MEWMERVREIAERVVTSEGMELVDVEFLGRGANTVLRIYIDKPGGMIGIQDCQTVSQQLSVILDVEDVIEQSYTLEVSSPGLDRRLIKPADFERFAGKPVKILLKGPRSGPKKFQGRLIGFQNDQVRIETEQVELAFGLDEIEKANLIVEFGPAPKPGKQKKSRT